MLVTKPFSGPRAALLWQYIRCFRWFFLLGAPIFGLIGYGDTGPSLPTSLFIPALLMVPLLVAQTLRSEQGFLSFYRRLPVTSATVVQIEATVVIGLVLWLVLNYWITLRIFDPLTGAPALSLVPAAAALGFLGIILARSVNCGIVAVLCMASLAIAILGPLSPLSGNGIGTYLFVVGFLLLAASFGYAGAVHFTRITRHGGRPGSPYQACFIELVPPLPLKHEGRIGRCPAQ